MIDYQNEIFTAIKKAVASGMPEANVTGQVGADPSRLPCVQAEEIGNLPFVFPVLHAFFDGTHHLRHLRCLAHLAQLELLVQSQR